MTTKSASSQTEPSNPIEVEKLTRGRPPKKTAEKSVYTPVVLSERVMLSLDFTSPKELSAAAIPTDGTSVSEESLRLELAKKLFELKAVPSAYAYYWQLVFSASFYLLRDKATQDKPLDESVEPGRSFSVRQVAQAAGLEYHNLKNLFMGRGTLRNLHDYQLFLYSQGIEFSQLQFNAQLIDKAYFYLICLRQPDISKEVIVQLFF